MAVEIVSPLLHSDTDCVCHLSKVLRMAMCSACGEPIYGRGQIHMPLIAFGLYCSNCCPCRTVSLTEQEHKVIRTNRRNALQQARSGAAVAKKRWADPAYRARHKDGMRAYSVARQEVTRSPGR